MKDAWNPYDPDRFSPRGLGGLFLLGKARVALTPPAIDFPDLERTSEAFVTEARDPDLVIDFGTSAIAAALVGPNGIEELDLLHGKHLRDSVFSRRLDLGYSSLLDNYAMNATMRRGSELFPCLKRRIELLARTDESGDWRHEAALDVAGVCAKTLAAARTGRGLGLAEVLRDAQFRVYITVPNAFPRTGIEVLCQGVAYGVAAVLGRRDSPEVEVLLEAESVAYGVVAKPNLDDEPHPETMTVLVLDAGAGTTDASIVRAHKDTLKVIAHVGLPVGGLDLDAMIMGLKGDYAASFPDPTEDQRIALGGQLRIACDAKEKHLTAVGSPDAALEPHAVEALARELVDQGWPEQVAGQGLSAAVAQGVERYLALAARGLIASLQTSDVETVDRVVISGRASLLAGFHRAARDTLAEVHGVAPPIETSESALGRKLAVVRGVGTFIRCAFRGHADRRPLRSSFEVRMRHSGTQSLPLIRSGQPLIDGWAVESWLHPDSSDIEAARARSWIELLLLPRSALRRLKAAFTDQELERLDIWASMPLLRVEKEAPYCARFGLNFLTLERFIEIDGEPIHVRRPARKDDGRTHPVHRLLENWYDIFRGVKA